MPRVPKDAPAEGESVDEPDRTEGAPAAMEGPLPPGVPVPDDEADDASVAELRAEATRRGVLPETGSGSGGRVVRTDLEDALEHAPPDPPAGRPPLALVAQAAAMVPPPEDERE